MAFLETKFGRVFHDSQELKAGQAPVFFFHAFPMSSEMWKPQIDALKGNRGCLWLDFPGLGKSEIGQGQYFIDMYVESAVAVMDHLKVERAILCGLSMGGYTALRFYERFGDRVAGLVLADTRSQADTNEGKAKRWEMFTRIHAEGVDKFAERFSRSLVSKETIDQRAEVPAFLKSQILSNKREGICGALLAIAARTDTTPVLEKINVPTLVIVGEHDALTPPSDSKFMSESIKGSRLFVIPGVGHMTNLESPAAFNAALLS